MRDSLNRWVGCDHGASFAMPISASADQNVDSNRSTTDVSIDPLAIVAALPQSCQETVDTKAFTGKGRLRDLRRLCADVDRVEACMRELSQATRRVPGHQMYLMVHRRHATGYVALRWRATGWSTCHLSWERAQAIGATYDRERRLWYIRASDAATALNQRHQALRKRLRDLEARLKKARRPIYARSISMD